MRDRRVLTRRGELWCGVWAASHGYVAESLEGQLAAFAETKDEAIARLAGAVERGPAPSAEWPHRPAR